MENDYVKDCLKRNVIFFSGKGGVGKSSVAWATALACQSSGQKVGVVSWNPLEEAQKEHPLNEFGIPWEILDPMECFKEYVLRILKFEKIFDLVFENHVLQAFLKAMPGLSETVLAGKIWDMVDKGKYGLLLVDMPASGHAYSFFKTPLGIDKIFGKGFVHGETQKICNLLIAPTSRIDFVALPEEMSVVETIEFKTKLDKLMNFPYGYLHLNQCLPEFRLEQIPPTLQNAGERYQKSWEAEMRAKTLAKELGLKTLEIPRYATEQLKDTVLRIKEALLK